MGTFASTGLARCRFLVLAAALAFAAPLSARAAVIDHPDVGGLRTFADTATGRVWLDLDNFVDLSVQQMIDAAALGGFTWATTADVFQLWTSLPLGSGQWNGYAAVMGRTAMFPAIVGVFDDGGSPLAGNNGFAWDSYTAWATDLPDFTSLSYVPPPGSFRGQWGIWAYQEAAASVPAPGALALLAVGLLGGGALRRPRARP